MTEEPLAGTEELHASRARIVASANAARRSLERRLHDGPQQHLVAMAVKLRLIENAIDGAPDEAKQMLHELRDEVQETVQQLRDIASAIFPPLLGDRGLAEALRAAAAREGGWAEIEVDESATGRYPADVEAAIYFAAVDAMHHADGPIALAVREASEHLEVVLRGALDDGAFVHVADHIHTVGGNAHRQDGAITATVPLPASP
ncbi:MAG TPA: histidine kinase [Acidimicrobiales bacterium]|nr:histidine kinase [Acidimicrobiales bacterium]